MTNVGRAGSMTCTVMAPEDAPGPRRRVVNPQIIERPLPILSAGRTIVKRGLSGVADTYCTVNRLGLFSLNKDIHGRIGKRHRGGIGLSANPVWGAGSTAAPVSATGKVVCLESLLAMFRVAAKARRPKM